MILVTWGTATEKDEHLLSVLTDRVQAARRDGNGISPADRVLFPVDCHFCLSGQDIVDLLSPGGWKSGTVARPGASLPSARLRFRIDELRSASSSRISGPS